MTPWLYIVFAAGGAWVLLKLLRKDVNGVGNKAREAERNRIKLIATLIELHAEVPDEVKTLARHLSDTV